MPTVSRMSAEDYAELAAFLAGFPEDESGSAEAWLDRMQAWWNANPAYQEAFSRGWLLREDGRIVGFFGSIPWKFQLAGKEVTVFAGTTWRVLAGFRGMSIALKRQQMDEHQDVLHFSTTPRAEVARMLGVLGYAQIPRDTDEEKHSGIILNFEKVLRTKLGQKRWGRAVAKCFAPVLTAVQSLRLRKLGRCRHENVRELTRADGAFDDLWNRTKSRHANTNVRTAEAINWYCFASKGIRKALFGYFDGDRLAGYAVFLSTEMRGMRFLECVDAWIESGTGRDTILGALVEKARRFAQRESFDRLLLPHFDAETAASYGRLGLPEKKSPRRPGYYKGPKEIMEHVSATNSYFVLAQGDYGL